MKPCSVLIIDDHPAMRHGIGQLLLAEGGMRILAEAGSREEALETLQGKHPDMVIMDLELGEKSPSGLDLIRELRALLGKVPILVFTMHDEEFYRTRAFEAGALGYVNKQGSVTELLAAIHSIREGKSYGKSPQLERGNSPADRLSPREYEVFKLLGQGQTTQTISSILNISGKTVESHKFSVKRKLGYSTVEELRQYALKWVGHTAGAEQEPGSR